MRRRKFIQNLIVAAAMAATCVGLEVPKPKKGLYYCEFKCAFIDMPPKYDDMIFVAREDPIVIPAARSLVKVNSDRGYWIFIQ